MLAFPPSNYLAILPNKIRLAREECLLHPRRISWKGVLSGNSITFPLRILSRLPFLYTTLSLSHCLSVALALPRDLKLSNLLLGEDGCLKIADFGLATRILPNEEHFTLCGTPNYIAPEVADARTGHAHGLPADIFSVGCLLHMLLTALPPFPNASSKAARNAKQHAPLEPVTRPPGQATWAPLPGSRLSTVAADVIRALLQPSPVRRVTVQTILQHRFFAIATNNAAPVESKAAALIEPIPEHDNRNPVQKNAPAPVEGAVEAQARITPKAGMHSSVPPPGAVLVPRSAQQQQQPNTVNEQPKNDQTRAVWSPLDRATGATTASTVPMPPYEAPHSVATTSAGTQLLQRWPAPPTAKGRTELAARSLNLAAPPEQPQQLLQPSPSGNNAPPSLQETPSPVAAAAAMAAAAAQSKAHSNRRPVVIVASEGQQRNQGHSSGHQSSVHQSNGVVPLLPFEPVQEAAAASSAAERHTSHSHQSRSARHSGAHSSTAHHKAAPHFPPPGPTDRGSLLTPSPPLPTPPPPPHTTGRHSLTGANKANNHYGNSGDGAYASACTSGNDDDGDEGHHNRSAASERFHEQHDSSRRQRRRRSLNGGGPNPTREPLDLALPWERWHGDAPSVPSSVQQLHHGASPMPSASQLRDQARDRRRRRPEDQRSPQQQQQQEDSRQQEKLEHRNASSSGHNRSGRSNQTAENEAIHGKGSYNDHSRSKSRSSSCSSTSPQRTGHRRRLQHPPHRRKDAAVVDASARQSAGKSETAPDGPQATTGTHLCPLRPLHTRRLRPLEHHAERYSVAIQPDGRALLWLAPRSSAPRKTPELAAVNEATQNETRRRAHRWHSSGLNQDAQQRDVRKDARRTGRNNVEGETNKMATWMGVSGDGYDVWVARVPCTAGFSASPLSSTGGAPAAMGRSPLSASENATGTTTATTTTVTTTTISGAGEMPIKEGSLYQERLTVPEVVSRFALKHLPREWWSAYRLLAEALAAVRARTPKVTLLLYSASSYAKRFGDGETRQRQASTTSEAEEDTGPIVKVSMMENGPLPDLTARWADGSVLHYALASGNSGTSHGLTAAASNSGGTRLRLSLADGSTFAWDGGKADNAAVGRDKAAQAKRSSSTNGGNDSNAAGYRGSRGGGNGIGSHGGKGGASCAWPRQVPLAAADHLAVTQRALQYCLALERCATRFMADHQPLDWDSTKCEGGKNGRSPFPVTAHESFAAVVERDPDAAASKAAARLFSQNHSAATTAAESRARSQHSVWPPSNSAGNRRRSTFTEDVAVTAAPNGDAMDQYLLGSGAGHHMKGSSKMPLLTDEELDLSTYAASDNDQPGQPPEPRAPPTPESPMQRQQPSPGEPTQQQLPPSSNKALHHHHDSGGVGNDLGAGDERDDDKEEVFLNASSMGRRDSSGGLWLRFADGAELRMDAAATLLYHKPAPSQSLPAPAAVPNGSKAHQTISPLWKAYSLQQILPQPSGSGGREEDFSVSMLPLPPDIRRRMREFPALIKALAKKKMGQ